MTYQFPASLYPLRDHLRTIGCDVNAFATDRQAAYVAQELIGSRIKFPPKGSDMTSTLFLIQKQLPGAMPKSHADPRNAVETSARGVIAKQASLKLVGKDKKSKPRPEYLTAFDPDLVRSGVHVFADGACVPNPGAGGWGVVVYRDGVECVSSHGGAENSTNNQMELTALLTAIEVAEAYSSPETPATIWTDSQYCVKGVNEWRHGWKAKGWQRGGVNAKPENRILQNAELWQAIDAALSAPGAANVRVHWVKGHAGHAGNERADELAEMGRQLSGNSGQLVDDLDAEFRAVMAG